MNSRNGSAKSAYTPNMDVPDGRKRGGRGIFGLILTLLLPPVGLVFLWRRGVFRARGRMLLTGIATVEMAVLFALLLPKQELYTETPVPAAPAPVTVAPDDGVVLALSNLDQLLAQRQAERDAAAGITPTPAPTDDAAYMAEQEAILDTTVYAVFGHGARLYHADTVCGTQSNRRSLTIREAMSAGMGACPDCNPPVYKGAGNSGS